MAVPGGLFTLLLQTVAAQLESAVRATLNGDVLLLLSGDSTPLIGNGTIIDSGPDNRVITKFANTSQGSYSPFGQNGWCCMFSGASDYVSIPTQSVYQLTGDFTVEAFINPSSFPAAGGVVIGYWTTGSAAQCSFKLWITSANKLAFTYGIGAANVVLTSVSNTIVANKWSHIAVTRTGSTVRFFVNGAVDTFTATVTGSLNPCSTPLQLGAGGATSNFAGRIASARMVNGSALYTSTFAPATEPLAAVAGTVLLALQDYRLVDTSSLGAPMTVYGAPGPRVLAGGPFGAWSYSPTTHGGSIFFDGAGDYLNMTTLAPVGESAYTLEMFVYITASTGTRVDFAANAGLLLYRTAAGKLSLFTSGGTLITSASVLTSNMWHHIALVRQASKSTTMYIDGVAEGTNTHPDILQTSWTFGKDTASSYMKGYISNLRLTSGVVVYNGAFAPPTSPLSSIVGTLVLLRGTNGGIVDQAGKMCFETVGAVAPSKAVIKNGTASMYFNGTGSYLTASNPTAAEITIGTGDFTVEAWIYPVGVQAATASIIIINSASTPRLQLGYATASTFGVWCSTGTVASGTLPATNTWSHVAGVRTAGVLNYYLNGALVSSQSNTVNLTLPSTSTQIGGIAGASLFNGYIDDLRVTARAVYTTPFTPPGNSLTV